MNRVRIMACVVGGVLCLWLGMHVATAYGQAQAVIDVSRIPPPRYVIKTLLTEKSWQAFKLDTETGQAWHLDKGDWTPISKFTGTTSITSNVIYDMQVLPLGATGFICIRIESASGEVSIYQQEK